MSPHEQEPYLTRNQTQQLEAFAFKTAGKDISNDVRNIKTLYMSLWKLYFQKLNQHPKWPNEFGFVRTVEDRDLLQTLKGLPQPLCMIFNDAQRAGVTGISSTHHFRLVNSRGHGLMLATSYSGRPEPQFVSYFGNLLEEEPAEIEARKYLAKLQCGPLRVIEGYNLAKKVLSIAHQIPDKGHPHTLR